MPKFEILCVTMHQTDFAKVAEMNIHSNVVFANQCDRTAYEEKSFDGFTAKMISTETRGVGINRNLALTYASADICLLADDDVVYADDMEARVLAEFDAHPDADVMIFHLASTDPRRPQISYPKTKKHGRFGRMPWGGVRIAFRLSALRRANVWFTTLFGGGCLYPSGEDSMFLTDLKRAGLRFYVSRETIGTAKMEESAWFTGYDEKFYFGKGAFVAARHPKTFFFWCRYYLFRYRKHKELSWQQKKKWMNHGRRAYQKMYSFCDIQRPSPKSI